MTSTNNITLSLDSLSRGLGVISSFFGGMMAEACAVCLEDQSHSSGVKLNVYGFTKSKANIVWNFPVTDDKKKCYNDLEMATENGAYAIAILVLNQMADYTVLQRSRKGTGFDYWLGKDCNGEFFQEKVRLEVSGIRRGSITKIRSRVKKKLLQVSPTDNLAPAFICVVEFGTPQTRLEEKKCLSQNTTK